MPLPVVDQRLDAVGRQSPALSPAPDSISAKTHIKASKSNIEQIIKQIHLPSNADNNEDTDMTTNILRIDASARRTGSISRDLTDAIVAKFDDATVVVRDVAASPLGIEPNRIKADARPANP